MSTVLAANSQLLRICNFGTKLVPYAAALALQEKLAEEVKKGLAPHTLLLLQHQPVYTMGKRGHEDDFKVDMELLRSSGVDIFKISRGGEVTFHGPGQVVAYPIVDIRAIGRGARRWVEGLEDVMINACGMFGVSARGRLSDRTGVWVGDAKVGAIGVRISRGVSTHGTALNVEPDLSAFERIVPCGQQVYSRVTSLSEEAPLVGVDQVPEVAATLAKQYCHVFGYDEVEHVDSEALMETYVPGATLLQ